MSDNQNLKDFLLVAMATIFFIRYIYIYIYYILEGTQLKDNLNERKSGFSFQSAIGSDCKVDTQNLDLNTNL